jgi:hypothetical protein
MYFDRHRGFAMGCILSGAGVGGLVMAPVLQVLLDRYGVRSTLRILAGWNFAVGVPVACVVRRRAGFDPSASGARTRINMALVKRGTFLYQVRQKFEFSPFILLRVPGTRRIPPGRRERHPALLHDILLGLHSILLALGRQSPPGHQQRCEQHLPHRHGRPRRRRWQAKHPHLRGPFLTLTLPRALIINHSTHPGLPLIPISLRALVRRPARALPRVRRPLRRLRRRVQRTHAHHHFGDLRRGELRAREWVRVLCARVRFPSWRAGGGAHTREPPAGGRELGREWGRAGGALYACGGVRWRSVVLCWGVRCVCAVA